MKAVGGKERERVRRGGWGCEGGGRKRTGRERGEDGEKEASAYEIRTIQWCFLSRLRL